MGYLRLVHSTSPTPANPDEACVAAFDRELDYVFSTLRRLGAASSELEDLAHEIFVVLYGNWPEVDRSRPLRPYLFGIAFRIVAAHRRRRSREVCVAVPEPEDLAQSPELKLQARQSAALLAGALKQIPLPRRAVLIMHDLDEIPIRDIAETLSITRFGAYARLRKARSELRAAIQRQLLGLRK
jgi:RNA polymerase sigma-70 factor (ECF subfamily)